MKKTTRKLLSLLLTIVMMIGSILQVSAKEEVTTRVNETWGYTIIEKQTATGFVRTILNEPAEADAVNYERTKTLLIDLGMKESIVNNLPEQSLVNYASCRSFVNTIYYCTIEEETSDTKSNKGGRTSNTGHEQYSGSGLEIDFIVAEMSGYSARFLYTVESEFTYMPAARMKDSLGACAQVSAIVPGTKYASYSYNETDLTGNTPITGNHYGSITDYVDPTYSSWNGSAVRFTLPSDTYGFDNEGVMCLQKYISNYTVHYEFQMVLNYPTLPTNFNAYASYTHTYLVVVNQDITIAISGTGASIGLSKGLDNRRERHTTPDMLIHYMP